MSARPLTLRARLLGAFALFSLALLVTYAAVLPRLVLSTEDGIFTRQLEEHVELARAAVRAGETLDPAPAPGVTVTLDGEGLDQALAAWVADLPPGIHEFNDEERAGTEARELFVAVDDAGDGRRLILLYDVERFEGMEGLWDAVYLTAIGAGLLVALVAVVVGAVVVRRLSRALGDLGALGAAGPLAAGDDAPAARRTDEIGEIARAWRSASEEARDAFEREKRFSRDASHELRTPITAALGALEMLEREAAATPERRGVLLARARTSLAEMQDLVTGFLWLAREARPRDELDPVSVAPEVRGYCELLGPRAEARGLEIVVDQRGTPEAAAPPAVVRIVLGNLLRNAVAHAERGTIDVALEPTAVRVTNTVAPGADASADGPDSFGFGLTIVTDLCRRFGWGLELGPDDAGGFTARVAFDAAGAPGPSPEAQNE